MAKDWLPIRVQTEGAKRQHVKSRIMGFPGEAMEKYFFQRLQSVTASAVDVMKNYITYDKRVFTDTGRVRAARGDGYAGRVDSGDMVNAITWRGQKISNEKYKFEFGWLDGEPGYSIFQEHGTKNGVQAMNSLAFATEFVRAELRLLGSNPAAFRATRASQWKGVGE